MSEDRRTPADERDETPLERYDRNWNELLQELRVTQTGVAILFSMLLTVPFTARFERLDDFDRRLYLVALLLAATSVALLVGPVAYHRVLFSQGQKAHVVRRSHAMTVAGLGVLSLALGCVVLLVFDVVTARSLAVPVALVFFTATVALWFVPALLRRRSVGQS